MQSTFPLLLWTIDRGCIQVGTQNTTPCNKHVNLLQRQTAHSAKLTGVYNERAGVVRKGIWYPLSTMSLTKSEASNSW